MARILDGQFDPRLQKPKRRGAGDARRGTDGKLASFETRGDPSNANKVFAE